MVEITSHEGRFNDPVPERHEYELTEASVVDPDAPQYGDSEYSESNKSQLASEAAIHKMKKLAQKIYDTTPGIHDSKSSATICSHCNEQNHSLQINID